MKKITFNAPLNHKAYSYVPMQIEVRANGIVETMNITEQCIPKL